MPNEEKWKAMSESTDFLEFLSQNDPLGLLDKPENNKSGKKRSVLIENFEEIVNFLEEKNREPQKSSEDIYEFQLYCRLRAIREDAQKIKELKDFDLYGLLNGESIHDITLEDVMNDDPLNLLGEEFDGSIFKLTHVQSSDRISPEYIARRKFCKDFETYRPMFEELYKDLETGKRKLALYHPQDLVPNKFYVLGGVMLYLKSVEGTVTNYTFRSGDRRRYDGRTECIFDNGTTSDMLYRSLDKALQKEGYAISEYEESTIAAESVNEKDEAKGFVYVLKSKHSLLKNASDVYKIGSTTTSVTERIKNAVNEPTYLFAGVEVVQVYRCFNIGARTLEDRLHTFFDHVRMNINIPDERGVVISPREWFHVSIEAVNEAVDKILNDTIGDYVYDPRLKTVIAKSATREAHETPLSDNDVYNKVLQEISYFGQSIEKKSALYQGKDEESLRDLFLTNLERRFDGITATGETFNFNGKTDILLKRAEDSSNVFIGECKIWKGQKKFLEAINQLFDRYLTVRDKRAALIFFVKSGSYSTVLKTIRENVGKHPYYKASENEEGDALYRYLFRLPDDMDANIELAIMAFNYQDKI